MRVSVVTPTLNMAPFLRDALDSVLAQDHPDVELLVVDGGSTDGTLELLASYGDRVRWVSEPDRGQAHAVNKGFAATSGDVFAFLNADDTYLPGAISAAVRALEADPEIAGVYGEGVHTDRDGRPLGPYPTEPYDPDRLAATCFICQPAAFVRRSAFAAVGGVDERLFYALDHDLWIRMSRAGLRLAAVAEPWATSRMHLGNKTLGARDRALREIIDLLKGHYGYAPVELVWEHACHLGDPDADQFFVPARQGVRAAARTFALGLHHNRRRPGRWMRDYGAAVATRLRPS